MKTLSVVKEFYRSNTSIYSHKITKHQKILGYLSLSRLLSFILFVVMLIVWVNSGFSIPYLIISFLSLVLFLILVKGYNQKAQMVTHLENLLDINRNELKALSFDFSPFGDGACFIDPAHPYAYDIDLFGDGSVFQQINRTVSNYGQTCLASWLLNIDHDIEKTKERQGAIAELANMAPLRQDFMALGRGCEETNTQRETLIQWASQRLSPRDAGYYRIAGFSMAALSTLSIILVISGLAPFVWLFALFMVNMLLMGIKLKTISAEHSKVGRRYDAISQYASQLSLIEKGGFESDILKRMQTLIGGEQKSSEKSLKKLARIINSFDIRLNLLVSLMLNGFFLWDFFSMLRLDHWKGKHGRKLDGWFDQLASFDALQSLANFYANNPGFTFATLNNQGPVIDAAGLCHPQIPPEERVTNDILLQQKGRVLIITGPNMAGKSTFLRTTALALVLAQCGAPVCAQRFACQNLYLFTGMRTTDSLQKSESYFYAELKRLREIIEAAWSRQDVFIVLDEILKGTNSTDKAEGSKAFLKKIISMDATGIVATHDLQLGSLETGPDSAFLNYCFEAETDGESVTYDYILKRGITGKMNATVLMKQMGII